ncbi:MAG: flagellar biosynthesis protein FlhF [Candidatus Hydrogenedentota bacterium]
MEQKFYKFQASTLDEAYRAMREKLGDEAIVIRTSNVTQGGILGGWFGRQLVEVTASATVESPSSTLKALSAVERKYLQSRLPADRTAGKPAMPTESALSGDSAQMEHFKKLIGDAQARMGLHDAPPANPMLNLYASGDVDMPMDENRGQTPVTSRATPAYPRRDNAVPAEPIPFEMEHAKPSEPKTLSDDEVRNDISEMRDMLNLLTTEMPGADLPKEFIPVYRTLLDHGVARKRAASLIQIAAKRGDLRALREPRVFLERLKMEMRKYISVTGGTVLHAEQRRVVALIGPTGVGKTTNLAKLAALFSVQERARVAVITADTYRVSATEQLKTYATIIDLDMRIAHDAKGMQSALHEFRNHDLVLIDTAGSSPYNEEQMKDLQGLLESANPDEVHLVLSASTNQEDLKQTVSRYAMMKPSALFFTKLDETCRYGSVFCLAADTGIPLSYCSVGQDVPDDLMLAHSGKIASMVLEGQLKRG